MIVQHRHLINGGLHFYYNLACSAGVGRGGWGVEKPGFLGLAKEVNIPYFCWLALDNDFGNGR